MHAEDRLLNKSCKREFVKDAVDAVEKGIRKVNVLFELVAALVSKTHALVYGPIFVSSSEENNVFRKLELQGEEQEYRFYAFATSINVVTKKEVVSGVNVSIWRFVSGCSKHFKETVKLVYLPVYVPEYLDR